MEGLFVLAFLGFAAVIGLVAYLSHRTAQQRIAMLGGLARSKGWSFTTSDPFDLPSRWDDPPFGKGYARRASNVLTGTVRDRPLVAFDYQYKEDSTDSKGNRDTTTYNFSVCVLRMPARFPPLHVVPETFLHRIGRMFGASDIELESEEFNRRYKVRCPVPKFASDVLTPRTMELLLAGEPLQFRFAGDDVVCWDSGRASPSEIIMRTETLARVIDGVPTFVWRDHGYDPQAQPSG